MPPRGSAIGDGYGCPRKSSASNFCMNRLPRRPCGGGRENHRDQMWVPLSGRKHLLRLRKIHCHACLGEHMFARLKRGDRNRCVQVRRSSDPNDIDLGVRDGSAQFPYGVASGTYSVQQFSELSYEELQIATTSTSGIFRSAGRWRALTTAPAPTIPIFSLEWRGGMAGDPSVRQSERLIV